MVASQSSARQFMSATFGKDCSFGRATSIVRILTDKALTTKLTGCLGGSSEFEAFLNQLVVNYEEIMKLTAKSHDAERWLKTLGKRLRKGAVTNSEISYILLCLGESYFSAGHCRNRHFASSTAGAQYTARLLVAYRAIEIPPPAGTLEIEERAFFPGTLQSTMWTAMNKITQREAYPFKLLGQLLDTDWLLVNPASRAAVLIHVHEQLEAFLP